MKKVINFVVLLMMVFLLTACDLLNETKKSTTENYEFNEFPTYKDIYSFLSNGKGAYMPSTGKVKALIIPIKFDSQDSDSLETDRENLEKVFFGDEEDTGWESVKTYLYKSSYEKLEFSGYITPWYTPIMKKSYYESGYQNNNGVISNLLIEALNYFDGEIDYNAYDADKDGVIDAVYLIYNSDISYDSETLWWAWQGFNNEKKYTFDNVEAYQYMWGGIDFMYHNNNGGDLEEGLNACIYIHETTHLMGADDYYDYSPNEYGHFNVKVENGDGANLGIGEHDMMDANVGDHNPVTKMMLGWIEPVVIEKGEHTIDLNAYSKTGEAIILCPSWSESKNTLSEFFIIDYYDYDGLNSQGELNGILFGNKGVRIYHVNAVVEKDGNYWSIFKYDNSYTEHAFITLINADGNLNKKVDFIDSSLSVKADALFYLGKTFIPNNHYEYVDKRLLKYSVTINSRTDEKVNLTIKYN